MSSVVKARFLTSNKKKAKQGSSGTPPASNAQPPPYLRPLTPETFRKQTSSSPIDAPRAIHVQRSSSPVPSPLHARRSYSSDLNPSALENGAHLSKSVPDLRPGIRHIRSTSQPVPVVSVPVKQATPTPHRESFSSVSFPDRSNSVNSESSYYTEAVEAPMILQEDIIALTYHVRTFSEALSALRNTFIECEDNPDGDPPEVKAHERLGEVLSVLKGVLNKYQPLHSTDILASAGTLISKVKSHNYEDTSKAPDEFYESIDQLALAFSSSVSDFLMGEQDMVLSESAMSKQHSRSLEDFGDDEDDYDERGYDEDIEDDQDYLEYKEDRKSAEKKESVDTSAEKADELDRALVQLEHGFDIAMQRTKIWAKYSKDIETYVDKRAHLELEYTAKLAKLAQTTRAAITEENYLPFQSIFVTALDQDIDYADNASKTYAQLMSSRFMEPLTNRRNVHERTRKDFKETWAKASKKLNEALVNLKKAKQMYIQKQQELEKEESSSATLSAFSRGNKKKEGDLRKADEAEEVYKLWVNEANARQKELENTKSKVLVELRQLVYQCDQTMKAVTCNYFQMMNALASPAPIQFQTLAESSRNYEPGSQFSEYVRLQQANAPQTVYPVHQFEPYNATMSDKGQPAYSRQNSLFDSRSSQNLEDSVKMSPFNTRRNRSVGSHNVSSSQSPMNAWSHLKENNSDAESTTSRSPPGSPSGSPTASRKQGDIPRAQSLELISSDDGDKGESKRNGPVDPGSQRKRPAKNRPSAGPFQNSRLSSAAETHRLKKLRSASKCRVCDSYVYFNGAECEVCGLTCHKKCLARLNIKCGTYAKVQRRMTTFGVDFQRHLEDSNTEENVPHIISACIDEIDKRGLDVKGIYRVSGVKSRVEKLCQAFENNEYLADLSETPPHVIAAVLKLYLRQLPESLLTFRLYPEFIRIAKESFAVINNNMTCKDASENPDLREEYTKLLGRLREIVMKLPTANRVTAARLIMHLKQVSDHSEANAMPGSNLAIVFGPTLLRPCENEATSTLSTLVEMPHQTRLVELLIASPETAALWYFRRRIHARGCPSNETKMLRRLAEQLFSQVFDLPETDESSSRETPVEKFTPPKTDREANLFAIQSVRSSGVNPDESYEAEDEASYINTPDTSQSPTEISPPVHLRHHYRRPVAVNVPDSSLEPPKSPSPSTGSGLGFGSEFFDLLAKSNNRNDVNERARYTIPEFLLPHESSIPVVRQEDSDIEDEYEDDTTQGTSGSRTPDDDLDPSRRISSPRSSNENLAVDDKANVPSDLADLMSRRSSSHSVAPSVISDFLDSDSLLPDLSDTVKPGKVDNSESIGKPDKDPRLADIQSESPDSRVRTFSGDADAARPRPRTLGLLKRNSDLPGRVQRVDVLDTGFFPIGMKSSVSDTNLNKDPYAIEEEVPFVLASKAADSSVSPEDSLLTDDLVSFEKGSISDEERETVEDDAAITRIDISEVRATAEDELDHKDALCEDTHTPIQSPLIESTINAVSPRKQRPPPVSVKPARSPTVEKRDFAPSESPSPEEAPKVGSRELIIPVMTALQERRASTPDCSTSQSSTDTKVPDRAESPSAEKVGGGDEKRSEAKPMTRSAYTTRISVRDRLQQYENNRPGKVDSGRKQSASELFNPNPVSSRKEMFEQKERGLYKRVGDMGVRKPRSDSGSGSGSSSGSPKLSRKLLNNSDDKSSTFGAKSPLSGSPKLPRRRLNDNMDGNSAEKTKPLEQEKQAEPRRRERREQSGKSDHPRSLVPDNLEKRDALKLDLHDGEKETLSPREIDIPLDPEEMNDKHRPRRSPNSSPRSSRTNVVRSPFPDVSNDEEREPQFV